MIFPINQNQQNQIPQDFEAEQAVLGAVIDENSCLIEVQEILDPLSFFSVAHRQIFAAMLNLAERNQPIDEVLLGDQLKEMGYLENAGGYAYLAELVDLVPKTEHVAQYARVVRDHQHCREMITIGMDMARKSRDPGSMPEELLAFYSEQMRALSENMVTHSGSVDPFGDEVTSAFFTKLEALSKLDKDKRINGLKTLWSELDSMIGGLENATLTIVAGRPGMGKTAFVISLIMNQIKAFFKEVMNQNMERTEVPKILFYSLEMTTEQVLKRFYSQVAKVDGNKIRDLEMSAEEWERMAEATHEFSMYQGMLGIDDTSRNPVLSIKADAHKKHRSHQGGVGLIVVDYIQICESSLKNQLREQEIANISMHLKSLSKELNCPVVALSQLNRQCEARTDKRPTLGDLRESGAIEQDANTVLFLYRDEYYDENSEDKGILEVIAAKTREGRQGTVRLKWTGPHCRIDNLSLRDTEPY